MNEATEECKSLESAWKVHEYINEYIRFADQKAGALIGVNTAVIGAMVWADLPKKIKVNVIGVNEAAIAISFVVLFVSFGVALWVIYPRLFSLESTTPQKKSNKLSNIYFGDIGTRSIAEYISQIETMKCQDWESAVSEHIWQLSDVANRKYKWIGASARLWLIGTAIAIVVIFINL